MLHASVGVAGANVVAISVNVVKVNNVKYRIVIMSPAIAVCGSHRTRRITPDVGILSDFDERRKRVKCTGKR